MSPALVVVLLALLLGIQPITTDVYLPALPSLQQDLGASMAQVQMTFAALLLSFGISQLVWGPLSDRFGRKPILLWGMGAYVLASVACVLAPSMALLIAARIAQGAAMGAAVMGARAVVRDLYAPLEGAKVMSRGLSGLGVIAILCTPLGGLLTDWVHWRAAMAVLAVFGVGTLALLMLRFQETIPARNPQALAPRTLWRSWAQIARHPTFASYCVLSSASYVALFTFLASSSFMLIQGLGLSKLAYGGAMAFGSVLYILGTIACRRLLVRWGIRRTVFAAGCVTFTAGALMAALAWLGLGPAVVWRLGRAAAAVPVHHGARRAPAGGAKRRCGAVSADGGRGVGAERLRHDGLGLPHGPVAGPRHGRHGAPHGTGLCAVVHGDRPHRLDPGTKTWRSPLSR